MRKIAIQNLKGGTGKTTTTINLAHALALRGKKVLVVDCDVQGNVAAALGLKKPTATMYHLLMEDRLLSECVYLARENVDVIPSDNTLAVAEMQLAGQPRREETLQIRLRKLTGYDFLLVDCGPSLSLLHQNALLLVDELIIPVSMDYLSLLGAQQIIESIAFLRRFFERSPRLLGIVPTLFDQRTNIASEIYEAIKDTYRDICPILPAIRIDTRLQQAVAKHKTIFEHAPSSRAAEDYARLTSVILNEPITVAESTNSATTYLPITNPA
jgi:chromosome partitioning protein